MDVGDRSPAVFVVTLILGILATVFVALRVISKLWVVKRFTSDDILAVVAWVFATGVSAVICAGAREGLGRTDEGISADDRASIKRGIYAFTVLYNPALMATKTSILILYIRMAAAHPFLRYASIATAVIVNIAGIVLTFIGIFQCSPVSAGFLPSVNGTCVDVVAMYLASAPINILTDLAILCLPLPILTKLRMPFKQKVALVCTFIVGGFVAIVDVVRILYLQNALKATRDAAEVGGRAVNFYYHASFSLMWSAVEVSVGLMCCCVLVLKPLAMRVIPGLLDRARRSTFRHGGGDTMVESKDAPLQAQVSDRPSSSIEAEGEDDGMDFFQMLAADPAERPITPPPPSPRISRRLTISSHPPPVPNQEATQTFFDFVNMKGRTPLTDLTAKEAWWPIMFGESSHTT